MAGGAGETPFITVGKLKELLTELPDDLFLCATALGNLNVMRGKAVPQAITESLEGYYIGYVDLALEEVDIYVEEEVKDRRG